MGILFKLLPYLRNLSFLQFIQGYRTNVAGAAMVGTGVVGLVFGSIPIPGGEGISWTIVTPEVAWGSLIGGLAILGIGGKLENLVKK